MFAWRGAMSVRQRLTSELRDHEWRLDTVLVNRLTRPTTASYRGYLCDVYSLIVPLERAMVLAGGLEVSFVRPRIRSGLIASDLLALGLSHDIYPLLARRFAFAPFTSRVEALGWLYVLERFVRVHGTLVDSLREAMPRELAVASRYLCCYDDALWTQLLARIEACSGFGQDGTNVITTIRDATTHVCGWLQTPRGEAVLTQRAS